MRLLLKPLSWLLITYGAAGLGGLLAWAFAYTTVGWEAPIAHLEPFAATVAFTSTVALAGCWPTPRWASLSRWAFSGAGA